MLDKEIPFIESKTKGRGLPYAIVGHDVLANNNELFNPTLRDFHVIFWFKKGRGKYYIDFKEYGFKAGDVVLLSKDHLQYFEPFDGSCEVQSIAFEPKFLYRNDSDLRHLFSFSAASHIKGLQVLQLAESDAVFLEEISKQMQLVFESWEGKTASDAFYHLLCLFLIKCEDLQNELECNKEEIDENDKLLNRFNELLEQNFKTEYKVDFYADELGLGIKTLTRIVKDKYHLTTKAIIDQRRVLEIKRQLKGTTKSVKEIAYTLGFEEPTNMIKYFKKHVGQTPNDFRSLSLKSIG
jgi:AraC-like DNA-binding protein